MSNATPVLSPATRYEEAWPQASPSELSRSWSLSNEMLNGSPSSHPIRSSTPCSTAARSSFQSLATAVVTSAMSPRTTTMPRPSAIAAAGRWSLRRRNWAATGVSAGEIVSATRAGRTITLRYQSNASTAETAITQIRSRHAQPAARSSIGGTGRILTTSRIGAGSVTQRGRRPRARKRPQARSRKAGQP